MHYAMFESELTSVYFEKSSSTPFSQHMFSLEETIIKPNPVSCLSAHYRISSVIR